MKRVKGGVNINISCEEIVEKYGDMVYRIAISHTKYIEDADDVFQNVFLALLKNFNKIEDGEYINPSLLFNDETITLSLNENDLNIGFISRGKNLNFKDSLAIQKYLENEFDFDFDSLNYNFTFSYLSNSPPFIYDKNIDVIFADRALDWEDSEVVSDYSLQSLYDAGYYRLKNIDTYFESKYDLFIPFYKSLKKLTNDKIYFYPALITPDVNNEALQVYSKGNEDADREQVVNMQAFYNDDYYF